MAPWDGAVEFLRASPPVPHTSKALSETFLEAGHKVHRFATRLVKRFVHDNESKDHLLESAEVVAKV